MFVSRETVVRVILTTAEVIGALKAAFPHDLSVQALPLNPSGRGVHLTAAIQGACGLDIIFKKDTSVPAPAPISHDPDPA